MRTVAGFVALLQIGAVGFCLTVTWGLAPETGGQDHTVLHLLSSVLLITTPASYAYLTLRSGVATASVTKAVVALVLPAVPIFGFHLIHLTQGPDATFFDSLLLLPSFPLLFSVGVALVVIPLVRRRQSTIS